MCSVRSPAGALWHGVLSADLYPCAMGILHALDALEVRGTDKAWIDALDGSFLCETWFFCVRA